MHCSICEIPFVSPREFCGQLYAVPIAHHWLSLHSAHGPPLGPWYPALQMHQLASFAPCWLCELLAHARQKLEFQAPTVALYVLFGQLWHVPCEDALTAVE
jgi:hypothetical protein